MGFGFLATLAGLTWLYFGIKKRNLVKLRQKMFQRNGGLLLQRRELFRREPFRPEPVPTFIQLCIFLISGAVPDILAKTKDDQYRFWPAEGYPFSPGKCYTQSWI
uniref:Uncharacterized protein n=1 Tax=Helianthus annuus TaxID=4232 RepID=A0A251V0N5_HELAN